MENLFEIAQMIIGDNLSVKEVENLVTIVKKSKSSFHYRIF